MVLNHIRLLPETESTRIAVREGVIEAERSLLYPFYYNPQPYEDLRYELEIQNQKKQYFYVVWIERGGNTVKIFLMEHPRNIGDAFYNDIANTPLSSCLILPSVWGVLEREHEVFFADGFLGKLSYQTIKKDIALFQPQLIAVHMVYQWDNHCELRQFFKEIRELCSASIVVCGFYPLICLQRPSDDHSRSGRHRHRGT